MSVAAFLAPGGCRTGVWVGQRFPPTAGQIPNVLRVRAQSVCPPPGREQMRELDRRLGPVWLRALRSSIHAGQPDKQNSGAIGGHSSPGRRSPPREDPQGVVDGGLARRRFVEVPLPLAGRPLVLHPGCRRPRQLLQRREARGVEETQRAVLCPRLAAGDQETAIGAQASVETLYLCASIVARSVPDPDAERS